MQVTDEMVDAALDAHHAASLAISSDPFEAMRAALTAALGAMWQPISEAPKDGRHVMLAMADDEYVGQGYYDVDSGNWYPPLQNSHEWPDMKMHPTHFMHIPSPPAQEEG
ncbi:hypothetical protein [Afipia carboxidovorans]|uniref:hypothetical protein n=1 Tax=Afipia carboxidovorans TaxID=40137 RepID=UPI0030879DDA|nr:hypothetical protein CRBSH125_10030 [Afipia carboxidovorans]BEV47303.1 hypothetical protein CRBSH125_34860 [Afipia carboxidovorans]